MHWYIVLLSVCSLGLFSYIFYSRNNQYNAIDALVKAQPHFSGSILGAQHGNIIFNKSYGMANYELDVPNTPDTKFKIASITKSITATAIFQLQEKGKLDINDSLSTYIPDYPRGNEVLIKNLLSHTSGIYDLGLDWQSFKKSPHTLEQNIERFKHTSFDFEPGTQCRYSNSNYILLSYIIEKASGQSYQNYIQDHIFKPLGMINSGYDQNETIIKNRASGYIQDGKSLKNADYIDHTNAAGSGGLYSTTLDLYRFEQALKSHTLLSQASYDLMTTPHGYIDDPTAQVYGAGKHYGYGWMLDTFENHKRILHEGFIDGFSSIIIIFPEDDINIIILSNIFGSRLDMSNAIAVIFLDNKK